MRLRRLVLRNFRGVEERDVEFGETGVTVVVGDNETGKSSLLEAFELLRTLPDDSRAGRLRSVQPSGRDVPTEVEADFTLGDLALTYRKRWFRQRLTELRVSSASDGVRTLTGREAHDEAQRLFGERVDNMLWAALVAGQANSLELPAPGSVAAVLTALDAESARNAGVGEVDHGESMPVVEAVDREYLRYFTATGRPTGRHAEALRAREEARQAVEEAEAACRQVEQDVAKAERLTQDRAIYADRLAEQEELVGRLEEQRRASEELLERVDRLRREGELAGERLAMARGESERRDALVAELESREQALAAAEEAAQEAGAALRAAEESLQRRTAELEAAREERGVAAERVTELDERLARLRDRADLAELSRRLAAVEEARAEERALLVALERNRVDAEQAEAAEEAHRRVLAARAALAAGAPRLRVRRMGDAEVEVDRCPRTETDFEVLAERPTELAVPGVLSVTVQPGEGAGELAAALEAAERAESELLAGLRLPDISAVRRAARERLDLERALAGARETLSRRSEGSAVEELREQRDLLAARLAGAPDDGVDEPGLRETMDAVRQELAAARDAAAKVAGRLADAEHAEALARKEFEAAGTRMTEARVRAEHGRERRDDLAAGLATARAERPDEELAEAVRQAERQADRIAEELDAARAVVADSGADALEQRLSDAVAVRDRIRDEIDVVVDELRHVEGRLEQAGVQGLATALDRARADLAHAERQAEILERRAAAAARLRETLTRHRAEARRRYTTPLRERIEVLGRVLHGPTFRVALGDDLEVTEREVDGVTLPVDSLSLGSREQLAILVRLAIAGLTATDGTGVPVILDDALGWSDPGRLQAMGALLARVGGSGQVILLTCVPDRYARIPRARTIRL